MVYQTGILKVERKLMTPPIDTSAYMTLRASILALDFLPGEKLSERGLEERLSASRTPIRAALMRLENEGLTQRDGRGWQVAPIDIAEIRALLEFREAIEVASVRYAVERAEDSEIADLRLFTGVAEASDDAASVLRDGGDFHLSVARLSRNPFLIDATENALTRLSRTRWLGVQTPQTRAQSRSEHLGIIAALEDRNATRAQELMSAHSRATRDVLLSALAEERLRLRGRGLSIVGSFTDHPVSLKERALPRP